MCAIPEKKWRAICPILLTYKHFKNITNQSVKTVDFQGLNDYTRCAYFMKLEPETRNKAPSDEYKKKNIYKKLNQSILV